MSFRNLDPENDPWLVTTLGEYVARRSWPDDGARNRRDNIPADQSRFPGGSIKRITWDYTCDYGTEYVRAYPPNGYAALGDIMINVQKNSDDFWNTQIVFIKKVNEVTNEKLAIPIGGGKEVGYQNNISYRCNINGGGNWQDMGIYRPISNDANYLPMGILINFRWEWYGERLIKWDEPGYAHAVKNDLVMTLKNSQFFNLNADKWKNKYLFAGGRIGADSFGCKQYCDYRFWSIACIYDRKEKDGSGRGKFKILSLFDGWIAGEKDLDHSDWPTAYEYFMYYIPFYMLITNKSKDICCLSTIKSDTHLECGWGPYSITPQSPECYDFARMKCRAENPDDLTGNYCLEQACRTTPQSDNLIICDQEFTKFCQKSITKDNGTVQYLNYEQYPDVCACFMPQDFLKKGCDSLATELNIKSNRPAMKVLNIDTSDPDQCTQNCSVNPICRTMGTIPDTPLFRTEFPGAFGDGNKNRKGKPIIKGGVVDRTNCEDRNVCIQNIVVNNEGKIRKLNISQEITSCGGYKDKKCARSKFGKCNIQKQGGKFYKKLMTELDQGGCGVEGEEFLCADLTTTPILDECNYGIRTTVLKQNFNNADKADVLEALNTLTPQNIKDFRPSSYYNETDGIGFYLSECGDCNVGFETASECFLQGNVWKQKTTKTKILNDKKNGGKDCVVDPTPIISDCSQNKDCKIKIAEPDTGCVNGTRRIKYNITELNSRDGKSCRDVISESIPDAYKANYPSIKISDDYNTAIVETSCENCEIGYKVDLSSNGGKCIWDGDKWTLKKIPVMLKEASGGGICPTEKLNLVNKKTPIFEKCNQNQDCEFSSTAYQDECDDNTGERVMHFIVDKVENGNGMTCKSAALRLAKGYSLDGSPAEGTYDPATKEIIVKARCGTKQNCQIDFTKNLQTVCDKNKGLAVDVYQIKAKTKGRGKTCDEAVKSNFTYDTFTIEEVDKVFVYRACEKYDPTATRKMVIAVLGISLLMVLIAIII